MNTGRVKTCLDRFHFLALSEMALIASYTKDPLTHDEVVKGNV